MIENFVSDNSNLEQELKTKEFQGKLQKLSLPLYPKLAASVNSYEDRIVFSQEGRNFTLSITAKTGEKLKRILMMMDGRNSLRKLQQLFSPQHPDYITDLVHYLEEKKLIDDAAHFSRDIAVIFLVELEDLSKNLIINQVLKNKLDSSDLQLHVIYGFAVEFYHLFANKAYIESALLNFAGSTQIQELINQLYCQEYGQDKLLLKALNSIGISDEDLIETIPLPQTMALCNDLAYWASFDSLFYFSILGILTNQNIANLELYLQTAEDLSINSSFLEVIKALINSQRNIKATNISHQIFKEISHIDKQTQQRLKSQIYLFAEIYSNFYTAIFNYYASTQVLLRRVSDI